MTDSTLQFYDSLAKDYDLIFSDWRQAVLRQGEVLDRLIQAELGVPPLSALDCSCGIGTQAIGLAVKGYQVHGTDISSNAVERASREAESFGVSPTWGVADFRTLAQQVSGSLDVVVSCDNSLPHLTSDDDLLLAARNMRLKLRDGGLLMVSIRDYDQIVGGRPDITSPRVLGRASQAATSNPALGLGPGQSNLRARTPHRSRNRRGVDDNPSCREIPGPLARRAQRYSR